MDRFTAGSLTFLGALFQEVILYGSSKRVTFKPRPDYRLIVSEMSLTR